MLSRRGCPRRPPPAVLSLSVARISRQEIGGCQSVAAEVSHPTGRARSAQPRSGFHEDDVYGKPHPQEIVDGRTGRYYDFAQANPSTDASYVVVATSRQPHSLATTALSVQQVEGDAGEHGAIDHRHDLREAIEAQLHHLAQVGRRLAATDSELARQFVYPKGRVPNRVLIAAGQAMLAAATPQKDALITLGVGETFLDDLSQALSDFDRTTENAHGGRRSHVGAVADLEPVTAECMLLVHVLDGLNQARFKGNAEVLAAWESSIVVAGPFHTVKEEPPEPPECNRAGGGAKGG